MDLQSSKVLLMKVVQGNEAQQPGWIKGEQPCPLLATLWASSAEHENKACLHFFAQTQALPTARFLHMSKSVLISVLILVNSPSHSTFPGDQGNTAFRKQNAFFPAVMNGRGASQPTVRTNPQVLTAHHTHTCSSRGSQQVAAGWITAAYSSTGSA